MLKYLESLLFEKTKDTQSSILYAQWEYDKKVVPSALNAISALFPHYSLHDETHSITIINNIVRVLGKESIAKLPAIDIWLILEASYNHDIGMVVYADELFNTLQTNDFINFFKTIQQDRQNGLYEFAIQFDIKDNKLQYKSLELNLGLHDGIKFILAEYFRQKHADRSKSVIENPDKLSTPRGVIPHRIFKILAEICSSHTKGFDEVMKLPFCEVGIDVENAHPRFISCLLRVGDLLDLDNNRFSEVMLRTITKIPIDTLNHKNKHLSIESFQIDRKINIHAKCKDYDTANITQHWFDYINTEIRDQLTKWNEIVPSKELGYLPTIGNLIVELADYDYIDGKKKPKFAIDTSKALELLQGAGLYDGAYQSIREILQNAVDATLLRIWLENENELKSETPQSKVFKDITQRYAIEIEIKEHDASDENKIWEFSVTDKGTGISTEELNFLMNTGSSSKNLKKANLIDAMPLWLRPSGVFGIGFQSIFMLTEQVKIETKSFFTEQFQIVELNSPNSAKDGGILIQKKITDHKVKPGSKLSFKYKTKAIPDRYSYKIAPNNVNRIVRNYDPFSNDSLDIEMGKVFDEIFDFTNKSCIPINLTLAGKPIPTKNDSSDNFDFFDSDNMLELNIGCNKKDEKYNKSVFYKNQNVAKIPYSITSIKFLWIALNIHKDKATKVLTLNRNEIRPEYSSELYKDVLVSSFRIITKNFDKIFESDEQKSMGSMFLCHYHNYFDYLKEFDIKKFDHWKTLKINIDSQEKEMEKLINEIENVTITKSGNFRNDEYELNQKELIIKLYDFHCANDYTYFLLEKLIESNSFAFYKTNDKEILFKKEKQKSPIPDDKLKEILKKGYSHYARDIIPCIERYFKLRLKNDAFIPYVNRDYFLYDINLPYPKMVSPYISIETDYRNSHWEVKLNDKLYNWVYENRYDEKTTLEEIKKAYDEFVKEFKFENNDLIK
ncbi:MAG: ATP-binding protein [Paludibacter sp.]|nr:ATP-binding protein [Paludibacter sp.]